MKAPTLLAALFMTPLLGVAAPGVPEAAHAKPALGHMQERHLRILDPKHLRAPGLPPAPVMPADTLLESLTQHYSLNVWNNLFLDKYFYDADLRKVEVQNETWDTSWSSKNKTAFVHSADGKVKADTTWYASDIGWTYLWNEALAYNASGKPTEIQTEEWDEGVWYPQNKVTYAYAGDGNQVKELDQGWLGGDWSNLRQTLTTYDGPARAKTDLVQDWSDIKSLWTDYRRILYKYAANGDLDSVFEQTWNDDTKAWINNWKTTYSFVSPGVVKEVISEMWDESAWVKVELMRNTYQGPRLTQVELMDWTDGKWVDARKIMHKFGPVVPISVRKSAGRAGSHFRRVPGGDYPIRFDALLPEGAPLRASIVALNGSRVGAPQIRRLVPGTASILWNGLDGSGAPATPGIYYLNVQGPNGQSLPFLLSR